MSGEPEPAALTVLAAASLQDVLPQVAEAWSRETGERVRFSFDSTPRIARQVESGAPADAVFSADRVWMQWLVDRGAVDTDTRVEVARNRLVLVVGRNSVVSGDGFAALHAPGVDRIALAGEDVPAGRAAEQAVRKLGLWDVVKPRVVRADHVRAALGWVARGEAQAAFVYATDVRRAPGVMVLAELPESLVPALEIHAAVVTRSTHAREARSFLAACMEKRGRGAFRAEGFLEPEAPP